MSRVDVRKKGTIITFRETCPPPPPKNGPPPGAMDNCDNPCDCNSPDKCWVNGPPKCCANVEKDNCYKKTPGWGRVMFH